MIPESTNRKQVDHLFKPGQSGNPLGRPKGSRNRLSEDFLRALADDFEAHGVQAIQDVRENSPKDYMKVIASILPKGVELDIELGASPELRLELAQFANDYRLVKQAMANLGCDAKLIEAVVEDDTEGE